MKFNHAQLGKLVNKLLISKDVGAQAGAQEISCDLKSLQSILKDITAQAELSAIVPYYAKTKLKNFHRGVAPPRSKHNGAGNSYDPQFKLTVMRAVKCDGNVSQVARDFGISDRTIRRWLGTSK